MNGLACLRALAIRWKGMWDVRDVHGNPKHGILDTADASRVKTLLAFECPYFISAVQVALPVATRSPPFAVDDDG